MTMWWMTYRRFDPFPFLQIDFILHSILLSNRPINHTYSLTIPDSINDKMFTSTILIGFLCLVNCLMAYSLKIDCVYLQ